MTRRYLYLQSISDALAIATDVVDHQEVLPPPGHTFSLSHFGVHVGSPPWPAGEIRLPISIAFDGDSADPHGWYTGTLADVLLNLSSLDQTWMGDWIDRLAELLRGTSGAILDAPVVLKGKGEQTMRWLQSTHRGELFGEQFQHGLAWGLPGDDPDLSEAEALEFAETLATEWATAMAAAFESCWTSDVKYTEVGVVQLNQDDAGGDVTESYGTQWFMYPGGSIPTGSAAGFTLPYEVSCCVSLQTDQRGARGKGRFYLPPFVVTTMAVHGLFNVGMVNGNVGHIGTYIDSVKGLTPHVPLVVSRKFKVLNEVKSINVGVVPDSQRRRRRSLSEARVDVWTAA